MRVNRIHMYICGCLRIRNAWPTLLFIAPISNTLPNSSLLFLIKMFTIVSLINQLASHFWRRAHSATQNTRTPQSGWTTAQTFAIKFQLLCISSQSHNIFQILPSKVSTSPRQLFSTDEWYDLSKCESVAGAALQRNCRQNFSKRKQLWNDLSTNIGCH